MGPFMGPLTGLFWGLVDRPLVGPILLSCHTIDTSSTFIIIIPHSMPLLHDVDFIFAF